MKIRKISILAVIFGLACAAAANAQKPETFDQAKALSTQHNRLLLLEFFREG